MNFGGHFFHFQLFLIQKGPHLALLYPPQFRVLKGPLFPCRALPKFEPRHAPAAKNGTINLTDWNSYHELFLYYYDKSQCYISRQNSLKLTRRDNIL